MLVVGGLEEVADPDASYFEQLRVRSRGFMGWASGVTLTKTRLTRKQIVGFHRDEQSMRRMRSLSGVRGIGGDLEPLDSSSEEDDERGVDRDSMFEPEERDEGEAEAAEDPALSSRILSYGTLNGALVFSDLAVGSSIPLYVEALGLNLGTISVLRAAVCLRRVRKATNSSWLHPSAPTSMG